MSVLSKQERCFIVRSWALVSPDLESHGYQFFIMLFKDEPSLYAKHFSNFDINDIERIRTHGLKVMKGVNSMVEAVSEENDESLIDQIHFVAHGHHLRGVTARNEFEVVCNNLEKYLAKNLGDNLSPQAGRAWKKFLKSLVDVVMAEQGTIE